MAARLNAEEKELADSPIAAEQLSALIVRISDGTLSNKMAKQVFDQLCSAESGEQDVDTIIEKHGLKQVSDSGRHRSTGRRRNCQLRQAGGKLHQRRRNKTSQDDGLLCRPDNESLERPGQPAASKSDPQPKAERPAVIYWQGFQMPEPIIMAPASDIATSTRGV